MDTPKNQLPFNRWSVERIKQGRKFCTSRSKGYHSDPRVKYMMTMKLKDVRDLLWQVEGADSPEEFEKVWRGMFRGKFDPEREVYVHFGDFRKSVM
jgi:hypothetical protein